MLPQRKVTALPAPAETVEERTPRWAVILRKSVTPVGAIRTVAVLSLLLTVLSAVLMCTFDAEEFPTFGTALWWATQTVTTVGYGDVAPDATSGRIVAVLVMLDGTALLTVSTAAITATFIETVRRRLHVGGSDELHDRLARIEAALERRR
jgi:voltage-gated potassium channel